jgi:hypothetical protein
MASFSGSERISSVQLRASLHAVLPIGDVDSITGGLPEEVEIENLASVIRSARSRLIKQRILQRLSSKQAEGSGNQQLDSRIRARPSNDTLMLLLHIGCDVSSDNLAISTGQSRETVISELVTARTALFDTPPNCDEHDPALLAGYRDGAADRVTTASISRQTAVCNACRQDLEAVLTLDDRLVAHIGNLAELEDVRSPGTIIGGGSLRSAVPIAVLALIVAAVVLTSAGLVSALSSPAATPLFADEQAEPDRDHGRIIYGTWDGGMILFDPVTATREVLRPEYYTAHLHDGANYLLSPGGNRVAIFAQGEISGLHWATRHVQITDIDGTSISELEWRDSPGAGWPTGWLNDDELLAVAIPTYQTGESNERFLQRLEDESRLHATNVMTGEQRTVYQGAVAQVIPSPDGSRLAIVRPRDPTHPGPTVEMWSVEDGVASELLGSLEETFTWTGRLLWRDDSEAVFLGEIASYSDERDESSRDSAFRGEIETIAISQLDRDGNLETVVDPGPGYAAQIAGFHDDYEHIIYSSFLIDEPESDYRVYRHNLSTAETREIALPQDDMVFRPTMAGTLGYQAGFTESPDDESFLIHLGADHYLPTDRMYHAQDQPGAIHLTWVDRDLDLQVSTMMSDNWRLTPLRWISTEDANALLDEIQDADYGNPDRPELVEELRPYAQLGPDSILSPDGSALPMVEQTDDEQRPYLWFPLVDTGRWVASGTVDQTWHSGSHAMFGVTELGPAGEKVSRLTQLSASQRGGTSVDGFFDPHGIDDNDQIRYSAPSASPDGLTTSYFTIDADDRSATLWMYPSDGEPIELTRFDLPEERIESFSPLSQWVDNNTMIFVEPGEWNRQVSSASTLFRATISRDDVAIDELLALTPRGRERGIEIVDLAIQPGGEYIAWRARHARDRNDPDDAIDSISIARTSNLDDALEIDRSEPSTGLDWSPSGDALAIGTGSQVRVYDIASHQLRIVSGNHSPALYPVWVNNAELWFNVGHDDDASVYRVRFSD